MRSLNPFTGKPTLFEIRLENDFIVFRGSEHEAAPQLLKGTVVLCLSQPLRIEDVHLKLIGTAHYAWTDAKVTATGISTSKVDKTTQIWEHKWPPLAGIGAEDPADRSGHRVKGETLQPGNYEWPFEVLLEGDMAESVEGLREASITYKLKATVARGKLLHDFHAYKQLRIIRTLEASALEFLHAMSIENIWPNKIDYSIVIPQKAVVFGSCIPVEMRFTPLLKGLELGDVTIKLIEYHDFVTSAGYAAIREYKKERTIDSWTIPVKREEHWQDVIQGSGPDGWEGQEGWVVPATLGLPRKLTQCLQDVNVKGIKVRHKLKIVVALNNPDGHVSELRATLPVSIFISPHMPLDEAGNLVRQVPTGAPTGVDIAPPAYEEHQLDELYQDIDPVNLHSPIGGRSGVSSPFRGHSRAASTENLPALLQSAPIHPDVLASRLHDMSLEERHRNASWNSNLSAAGAASMTDGASHVADGGLISPPLSAPLTRHNSGDRPSGSNTPPEHLDFPDTAELSKVPSYHTAVRTPVRVQAADVYALPNYETAVSAQSSPPGTPRPDARPQMMPFYLDSVPRTAQETAAPLRSARVPTTVSAPGTAAASREPSPHATNRRPVMTHHRRQFSSGFLHSLRTQPSH
ncbi:hypothetical protein VTH06DRAFT_7763 [Thermothelomyces fergusii]